MNCGTISSRYSWKTNVELKRESISPQNAGSTAVTVLLSVAFVLSTFRMLRLSGSVQLADLFVFLALLLIVINFSLGRRSIWLPWWFTLGSVFAFLPALLIYVPNGIGPKSTIAPLGNIWLCWLLIPVVVANSAINLDQLRMLFICWAVASIIAGALALLATTGVTVPGLKAHAGARLRGYTEHANVLAQICSVPLPALLGYGLSRHRFYTRCWVLSSIIFLLYVVNLTGSRKALAASVACMAFVAGIWLITSSKRKFAARILAILVVCVGLASLTAANFTNEDSSLFRLFHDSYSATRSDLRREILAEEAWNDFWSNPLIGVGYDKFISAHNSWLSMLRCGGIFGLMFILIRDIGIISCLKTGLARSFHSSSQTIFLIGLIFSYASWLLASLKSVPGTDRYSLFGIGLAIALSRIIYTEGQPTGELKPKAHQTPSF